MIRNNVKGQALIETALVLILLLILFLGIAEFSRAWYTKNSLKNAVRSGARVAVVTPFIDASSTDVACSNAASYCDAAPAINASNNNAVVIWTVCCAPGVSRSTTTVTIGVTDSGGAPVPSGTDATSGNTVDVSGTSTFSFVIGNSPWPWPKTTTIITDASMRYE